MDSFPFHLKEKCHFWSTFCLAEIIKSIILHRRTSMYKDPEAWAVSF